MKKRVSFITLGCKVNQYETNAMMQKFQENGYEIVEIDDVSDICVVNTCTVTNMSDRKSRQALRKVKDKNENAIIVATGCYAQSSKEELEKMPEIDVVLGNEEKRDIVKYVEKYFEQNQKLISVQDISAQKEFEDMGQISYTEKIRAVIKVQDGCNQFCSYCIIPYARGRIRSRKIESVKEEVIELAKNGIKEVVVTGIHVASYGKDLEEDIGLIDLLEEINKIDGIERIRLSSLEPTLITEDFVNRLSKLNKICDHFHLSLQSGCDETLKRMNRHYTTAEFKKATELLRKAYPNVALTTDIIVGFPGETDEEFNTTYEFLKGINFYKMHVFKYSPRHGTKAEKMPNQVDGNIKEERSRKLIELSDKNEKDQNKKYINTNLKVLIEEFEDGYYKGHTTNYIMVKIKENAENLQNKIVTAKIIGDEGIDLIGKLEEAY